MCIWNIIFFASPQMITGGSYDRVINDEMYIINIPDGGVIAEPLDRGAFISLSPQVASVGSGYILFSPKIPESSAAS